MPDFLKTQNFKQKMEAIKARRLDKEELLAELEELQMRYYHLSLFNLNFFKKLEEETEEQVCMKRRLDLVLKMQEDKTQKGNKKRANQRKAASQSKQSFNEYCLYLRRKNIMETKVFKKKYEAVNQHISGIPKLGRQDDEYKPSVFSEQLSDPKMNIPQNKELFNNVIKYQEKDSDEEESKPKVSSIEEDIENEIKNIKGRLNRKFQVVDDVNYAEFLQFMMANYDYNHDYWKLNKDLTLKLKEEEERNSFLRSQTNF
jgi:hypothetical protein